MPARCSKNKKHTTILNKRKQGTILIDNMELLRQCWADDNTTEVANTMLTAALVLLCCFYREILNFCVASCVRIMSKLRIRSKRKPTVPNSREQQQVVHKASPAWAAASTVTTSSTAATSTTSLARPSLTARSTTGGSVSSRRGLLSSSYTPLSVRRNQASLSVRFTSSDTVSALSPNNSTRLDDASGGVNNDAFSISGSSSHRQLNVKQQQHQSMTRLELLQQHERQQRAKLRRHRRKQSADAAINSKSLLVPEHPTRESSESSDFTPVPRQPQKAPAHNKAQQSAPTAPRMHKSTSSPFLGATASRKHLERRSPPTSPLAGSSSSTTSSHGGNARSVASTPTSISAAVSLSVKRKLQRQSSATVHVVSSPRSSSGSQQARDDDDCHVWT